jgi:hypothetical protein
VNEEVGVGLEEETKAVKERPVLFRELFRAEIPDGRVRVIAATCREPVAGGWALASLLQEHLLVVPEQADDVTLLAERNDQIENAQAVGPSVDVVAEEDEGVERGWGHGFKEPIERVGVAVDVTDGDGSWGHS